MMKFRMCIPPPPHPPGLHIDKELRAVMYITGSCTYVR